MFQKSFYSGRKGSVRTSIKPVSLEHFNEVMRRNVFLKLIVSNYSEKIDFKIPDDYDYKCETYRSYCHKDYISDNKFGTSNVKEYDLEKHGDLYGDFISIRKTIDYSWHTNYTRDRQKYQDQLVRNVALRHGKVDQPWLVFTGGAMGAGKGRTMQWMSENDIFPLENIVRIDPDQFKQVFPTWKNYVASDKWTAGKMCHKESGFLQEIAQEVSLQNNQNTWIDGSLQDSGWYTKVFADLRRNYPHYRIAIFYVYAKPKTVLQRMHERGERTGRYIPEKDLMESMKKCEKSIKVLGPLSDFLAIIRNEGPVPQLERFEDRSHSYSAIRHHFSSLVCGKFPQQLGPLRFRATEVKYSDGKKSLELNTKACMDLQKSAKSSKILRLRICEILPDLVLKSLPDSISSNYDLVFSPVTEVNFDEHSRRTAGIPLKADSFSWCYGAVRSGEGNLYTRLNKSDAVDLGMKMEDPLTTMLVSGAYVYIGVEEKESSDVRVLGINTFCKNAFDSDDTSQVSLIYFGPPESVPQDYLEKMEKTGRMLPTTLNELKNKSRVMLSLDESTESRAEKYGWVLPGELSTCPFGGFIYQCSVTNQKWSLNMGHHFVLFPCIVAN